MPRNESLSREADSALARADWTAAEAVLEKWSARDAGGDPALLEAFRRLEEGRGTRLKLLPRVEEFRARHPTRANDPRVLVEHGFALRASGEGERARAAFLGARDRLHAATARGDEVDARTLATAEAGIGLTWLAPLDAERARAAFKCSREIAERAGLPDRVCFADLYLAHVELEVGAVERAARLYRRALVAYERLGDEGGVRHAAYNLGNCLQDLGRPIAARRSFARALAIAKKRNEAWWEAWCTELLGEVDHKAGRLDEAEAKYLAAEAIFRRLGGPTPTEQAWVNMRLAEVYLDRGDLVRAERLARAGVDERVEPTPRTYGSLLMAIIRSRKRPGLGARAFERVAAAAERYALNDIAWRARARAAHLRVERSMERALDGAPPGRDDPDAAAARAHVLRARATLEETMGAMRTASRRRYLRDRTRSTEAAMLFRAEALVGSTRAPELLSPTLAARSAWLRLLGAISESAAQRAPIAVLRRAVDAIVELAGAGHATAWLDANDEGPSLVAARDHDLRDVPAGAVPSPLPEGAVLRPIVAAGRRVGQLLLTHPRRAHFDAETLELVDALSSVASTLVDAARTRSRLEAQSEAQAREAIGLAAELARAEVALDAARSRLSEHEERPARAGVLGRSPPMQELFTRLDRLRGTALPVLVTGESGTGKELVARVIHDESARAGGPFVAINCGALAESLLESELFGHVRGAFSGATRDAPGLFVVADRGTLLLDEVGEMSLAMQAKLLRVLQEGELRAVGAERTTKIDVRVLAATHRDLAEMVRRREFREDLYYRLHVLTVHVPPLRVRGDDALLIARKLLADLAPNKRLGADAAAWIVAHTWPGNVRELRAVIEAATVLAAGDVLSARDLRPPPSTKAAAQRGAAPLQGLPERLEELEALAIERALTRHGGNRVRAAEALGIGRATLYRKLVAYGLTDVERRR